MIITITVLSVQAQTKAKNEITSDVVKQEVAKVVKLLEVKVPRKDNERSVSGIRLLYHTKSKDLILNKDYGFIDIGANGWGEDCNKNDCDGMPTDNPGHDPWFKHWSKETKKYNLTLYYEALRHFEKILNKM